MKISLAVFFNLLDKDRLASGQQTDMAKLIVQFATLSTHLKIQREYTSPLHRSNGYCH